MMKLMEPKFTTQTSFPGQNLSWTIFSIISTCVVLYDFIPCTHRFTVYVKLTDTREHFKLIVKILHTRGATTQIGWVRQVKSMLD